MNDLLYWGTISACLGLMAAYICRLKVLNVFGARVDYVAFHACWLAYSGWVLSETLQGQWQAFYLLPLAGAALWLEISWHSWRQMGGKPPRHMLKGKALRELDAETLRHVAGGTKKP